MARERSKLTTAALQRLLVAVGIVALGGALLVWNRRARNPRSAKRRLLVRRGRPFPPGSKVIEPGTSTVLAVTLTPGRLRDPARGNPLVTVGAGVHTLRLVLEVEHRPGDALYRVLVETPDRRRV